MSYESNIAALSQEAIARMNAYQLVDRAVGLHGEARNMLGLEPIELENGGTLHTVTSGLAANRGLSIQTVIEEDEIVRRQVLFSPLTVFADVVELCPPRGQDEGNALLYRVEEALTPALAEARAPFYETVVALSSRDNSQYGKSPINFDRARSRNTLYSAISDIGGPDETYLGSSLGIGKLPLLAGEHTRIDLREVARNDLDQEIGVLATLSGLAHIVLNEQDFVRITRTGVFYGPNTSQKVEVDIPQGTLQHNGNYKFHRIPDGATVVPDGEGNLIPRGDRTENQKYKHTKLNPFIGATEVMNLIPSDTIDWTDGTTAFIKSLSSDIAKTIPLDAQASYEQTLRSAQDKVRDILLNNRKPLPGGVGCLAVTARLAMLPPNLQDEAHRVDAEYFTQAS